MYNLIFDFLPVFSFLSPQVGAVPILSVGRVLGTPHRDLLPPGRKMCSPLWCKITGFIFALSDLSKAYKGKVLIVQNNSV